MWTAKDQVESYILKYKEEVYKYSEDANANQELVNRLRAYFKKSEERGDTHLKQAHDRLLSPRALAKRHLEAVGIKVPRSKPIYFYVLIGFLFFIVSLLIALSALTLWFVPKVTDTWIKEDLNYSFFFDFNQKDKNSKLFSGTYPDITDKKIYINTENMYLKISQHEHTYLSYKCEAENTVDTSELFEEDGKILIFLLNRKFGSISCHIYIPPTSLLEVEAENLNIEIEKLSAGLSIRAMNANVNIGLDASKSYFPTFKSERALIMNQSKMNVDSEGIPIFLDIKNGSVSF